MSTVHPVRRLSKLLSDRQLGHDGCGGNVTGPPKEDETSVLSRTGQLVIRLVF